jgi:hypothetical protein
VRKFRIVAVACLAALAAACAKSSDQIAASYVSPMQYENLRCPQIAEEAQRVSSRAAILSGQQDSKATRDAVVTTVGVIVFWPVLFAIGGNDQQTAELARLRGELEALEQASIRKSCGLQFQLPQPPQPPPAEAPRT